MSERTILMNLDAEGQRIDSALAAALPDLSRSQWQRLIHEGLVTIEGHPVKASLKLKGVERVSVVIPEIEKGKLAAEPIPLDIRLEDRDIIVINKPAGMVVHPAAGHWDGTLVNAILYHCPDLEGIGGERRPGIVHRLDKNTSGLIIVAKNEKALRYLQKQFRERSVDKVYLALVYGKFSQGSALIDAPIGRDPKNRKKMSVIRPGSSATAREAQTRVHLVRYYGDFTLLECRPITGRTHQIRVHMSFAGYPVVGDRIYGRKKEGHLVDRHFLHAARLAFRLPGTGKSISIEAELPEDLAALLESL